MVNAVRLDFFCPLCGARDIWLNEGDVNYGEGISHYCLTCHVSLPDLGATWPVSVIRDRREHDKYIEIRRAAGRPEEG